MIDTGIIASITLRYGQEAADQAIKKLEKKISDGSFKNPENKYGVELYLESICKDYKRPAKEKHENYKLYRLENIFEEITKERGDGWFLKALSEIKECDPAHIQKLKQYASSSWHYCKVKSKESYGLSSHEEKLLTRLYLLKQTPETSEEKALSDRVFRRAAEIEKKALSEAMAVIWVEGYKDFVEFGF